VFSGSTNILGGSINNTFTVNSPNSGVVSFTSVSSDIQQLDFLKTGTYKLSAQYMINAATHTALTRFGNFKVTSSTVNFLNKIPSDSTINHYNSTIDYVYNKVITKELYFQCTAVNQILKLQNTITDLGSTGEYEQALGYVVTPIAFT
jgi:hypothetical protein